MNRRLLAMAATLVAVAAVVGMAGPATTAHAVTDDDPPTHETVLVPIAELGARASAVALHNSVLYVVLNARLATLDVTGPAQPALIAAGPALKGEPNALATDGAYAYVALGEAGVAVVDVRDAATPKLLLTIDTPGTAMDVAVDGPYLYVADGTAGLRVVDVSTPGAAHEVGSLRTPRLSRSVVARDGWVYVGERDDLEYGVWVVDASDPTAPRTAAFADVPGGGDKIALRGTVVYASVVVQGTSPFNPWAGGSVGIAAIDVTDPAHPVVVMPAGPPSMREPSGSVVADLLRPGPQLCAPLSNRGAIARTAVPAQTRDIAGLLARDLAVGSDRVYLVSGRVGATGTPGIVKPNDPVVASLQMLSVYSVKADPLKPNAIGNYVTPGQALGVAGTAAHAFVADGTHGVVVVNGQSNPPLRVGGFDAGVVGHPVALDVLYDVLAIADGDVGLRLADISVPEQPDIVGSVETRATPVDVDLYRDYAFVALQLTYRNTGRQAEYIGGLDIVNVADPSHPTLGAEAIDDTNASGVQVWADRAFVTSWQGGGVARERGMHVVDVSRPLKPEPKIVFDEILEPSGISIAQDIAFVTETDTGVWAINVQKPDQPVKESFVGTSGPAVAVAGWDGYAYVADGHAGLMIADMRDPDAPDRVASLGVGGEALDVAVADTHVVVAAGSGGARLIDVRDPAAPIEVDHHDGRGTAISVAVRGDVVFVGLAEGSIQVFRIEERALPTPTPTMTPSVTPTDVPTVTATPTSGPATWPVYLPVVAVLE